MPLALHPSLKRGLDFGDPQIRPEDLVEDRPEVKEDSEAHAAKRRRVESIAFQCLRGRPPIILSAGLRGPFGHGWKNPWKTTTVKTRAKTKSLRKSNSVVNQRSDGRGGGLAMNRAAGRAKPSRRGGSESNSTLPQVASPEASRAAGDVSDTLEQDYSINDVEVPPATAPWAEEDDASGATEYHSADTQKCNRNRSSLRNPFWLRRPDSERSVFQMSVNPNTDISPTRSRSRGNGSTTGIRPKLQLSAPRESLRIPNNSAGRKDASDWRSSASASMVFSSPPGRAGETPIDSPTCIAHSLIGSPATLAAASIPGRRDMQPIPVEPPADTHIEQDDPSGQIPEARRTSLGMHQPEVSNVANPQYSTKLIVEPTNPTTSIQNPRKSKRQPSPHYNVRDPAQQNLIASSGPTSSIGFVYRKVGVTRGNGMDGSKPKPRAINFDSQPALEGNAITLVGLNEESVDTAQGLKSCTMDTLQQERANVENEPLQSADQGTHEADNSTMQQEGEVVEANVSSGHSAMSTQAAMLLAQLEFQESTLPPPSISPQPWSRTSRGTPRSALPEPSPAITPISVFTTRLDKGPQGSVLRGALMSTQDLFGAASPFTFSTIKKKSEAAQWSSLKSAKVRKHDEGQKPENPPAKSPTSSAGRIPLKAKNTSTTSWSFVTEKTPQASQESLVDRTRRSFHDVELPQLDFHTSLDDFGPDNDLHFTDRFLQNLDHD